MPGHAEVAAAYEPLVDDADVVDAYLGTALPLALQASSEFELVHGGAVLRTSGVVTFCGVSGVGKTTVAHALAKRSRGLWADDAVAMRVAAPEGTALTMSLPFVPNLRESSLAAVKPLAPLPPWQSATLLGIVLLEPSASASRPAARIEESAGRALEAILPNTYRFVPRSPKQRRKTVEALLEIVSRVPVLHARYRLGLEGLPLLVDELERAIEELAA